MKKTLKYYNFYLCPFCKPVDFFLDANKVPHEKIHLDLYKQEHKSEEYKKINPFQKVPAVIDGDFILFESNTIMRYIANTKETEDFWYPKDAKKRAIVDLYFDWHAGNVMNLQNFNYTKLGRINKTVEEAKAVTEKAIKDLIDVFLSQRKFVASNEKVTIADLALVYHVGGTRDLGYELPGRVEEYYNEVLNTDEKLRKDATLFLKQRREVVINKKKE